MNGLGCTTCQTRVAFHNFEVCPIHARSLRDRLNPNGASRIQEVRMRHAECKYLTRCSLFSDETMTTRGFRMMRVRGHEQGAFYKTHKKREPLRFFILENFPTTRFQTSYMRRDEKTQKVPKGDKFDRQFLCSTYQQIASMQSEACTVARALKVHPLCMSQAAARA